MNDAQQVVDKQAAVFNILADSTRLKLVKLLQHQHDTNALCVSALANLLGVTQSAVFQHLRVLKTGGLVRGERHGYHIHYFINQKNTGKISQACLRNLEHRGYQGKKFCKKHCTSKKVTNLSAT